MSNCKGCPGCLEKEKRRQEALIELRKKAKAYAVDYKQMVVIYYSDKNEPEFITEAGAVSAGITASEFVSYLQPINDGSFSGLPV